MHNTITVNLFRLLLAVIFFAMSAGAQADLQDATEAYEKGNYPAALKEFRRLAVSGDATAQYNLGMMYHKGQGVAQDFKEAAVWYRYAVKQGDADALNSLGILYQYGEGVSRKIGRAHV